MARNAAFQVLLPDGLQVGFGLISRGQSPKYSVQFRDLNEDKLVLRSTGERSRPRAIASAEKLIKEYYTPIEAVIPKKPIGWDDVMEELTLHLESDAARPSTISDYIDTLNQVRPLASNPTEITAKQAQAWCNEYVTKKFSRTKKPGAKTYKRSPRTLHARVRKLKAIWGKYFIKRMNLMDSNPWMTIELPRLNELTVRTLSSEQVNAFFKWLDARWKGWEFPALFFETKAVTGCRLGDLCDLKSVDLKDGRITFQAESTKARKNRVSVLPPDLFASLKKLAGPMYLWERYTQCIRESLISRGRPTNRVRDDFDPKRLSWWAKDEIASFNRAHPHLPKIKSHDFRKRAITEAHRAGVDVDTAASAVGMSSNTARGYYLALDQAESSALVTSKIGNLLRPNRSS